MPQQGSAGGSFALWLSLHLKPQLPNGLECTLLLRVPAPRSPSHCLIHSGTGSRVTVFLTRQPPTCLPCLPPNEILLGGCAAELQLPETAPAFMAHPGSYQPPEIQQEGNSPCCPLWTSAPWRAEGDSPSPSTERHGLLDSAVRGKQGRRRGMQTGEWGWLEGR